MFQEFERQPGTHWQERFEVAPACDEYVRRPLAVVAMHPAASPPAARPSITASKERRPASELLVLIRRYVSVITADKGYVRFLVAQAPFITLLILLISPSGALAGRASPGDASTVLLSLVLGATFLGQSNAIREICKELPIYVRERAVGLSIVSYVASKAVVLGAITVAEAGFLVAFGTLRQHGPAHALSALGSSRCPEDAPTPPRCRPEPLRLSSPRPPACSATNGQRTGCTRGSRTSQRLQPSRSFAWLACLALYRRDPLRSWRGGGRAT